MANRDINIGVSGFDPLEQHLIAGGELLRQNRVQQARVELEAALKIDPDNVKVLGLLGLACFRMDDFVSARPVYEKLVAVNRNDASFSLNLGLVYLKVGDAAGAISELTRSRELDPSQGRALSYLGLAYARNGDYQQAYQAFLQAGESELAREMEQYLSAEERESIQEAVNAAKSSAPTAPPSARPVAAPATPAAAEAAPPAPATPAAPPAPATPAGSGAADEPAEEEHQAAPADSAAASDAGAVVEADDEPRADDPEELDLDYDDVELISVSELDARPEGAIALVDDEAGASADDDEVPEFVLEEHIEERKPRAPRPSAGSAGTSPTGESAGVPTGAPDRQRPGIISQAVKRATPSRAAAAGAARVAVGHKPPRSLTEFATARLIRPEDGDHTFETSAGGVLIIRVDGRVFARTEGVHVTGGDLAYEVASRHSRGSSTGEEFSTDGRQLFIVSGHGHLIAAPLGGHFTAVNLDEDILYLREDLVFAFEEQLRWENGHVPGSGASIGMVQFRGRGSVAFRTRRPLLAIKLAPERVLYVDAKTLAGWVGRVMPRAVVPAAGGEKSTLFVECTGEGVILVEEDDVADARSASSSVQPSGDDPESDD